MPFKDLHGFAVRDELRGAYDASQGPEENARRVAAEQWQTFLLSVPDEVGGTSTPKLAVAKELEVSHKGYYLDSKQWQDLARVAVIQSRSDTERAQQLQTLVHLGIPHPLRCVVWPLLLGADERKGELPLHYKALVELGGETRATAEQIERDLPRTFATHGSLSSRQSSADAGSGNMEAEIVRSQAMLALKRVLTAFAAHDDERGYVQAMNFMGAFLLLADLSEDDCFWCLAILVENVIKGYFDEGMLAAQTDQMVFQRLVSEELAVLGIHLGMLSPPGSAILPCVTSQWFLTLFVNVLPSECALRLWDVVMLERHRGVMLRFGLALLHSGEKLLLQKYEMGDCIEVLQGLAERAFEITPLMEEANLRYTAVTHQRIESLYRFYSKRAQSQRYDPGWQSPFIPGYEERSLEVVFAESRLPLEDSLQAGLDHEEPSSSGTKRVSSESKAQGILEELTECQAISDGADLLLAPNPEVLMEASKKLVDVNKQLLQLQLPVQRYRTVLQDAMMPLQILIASPVGRARTSFKAQHSLCQQLMQRIFAPGARKLASEEKTLWGMWAHSPLEECIGKMESLTKQLKQMRVAAAEALSPIVSQFNAAGKSLSTPASDSGEKPISDQARALHLSATAEEALLNTEPLTQRRGEMFRDMIEALKAIVAKEEHLAGDDYELLERIQAAEQTAHKSQLCTAQSLWQGWMYAMEMSRHQHAVEALAALPRLPPTHELQQEQSLHSGVLAAVGEKGDAGACPQSAPKGEAGSGQADLGSGPSLSTDDSVHSMESPARSAAQDDLFATLSAGWCDVGVPRAPTGRCASRVVNRTSAERVAQVMWLQTYLSGMIVRVAWIPTTGQPGTAPVITQRSLNR